MTTTKKYTISEIAAHNKETGHFFFSRDTLKFFGQSKGMFKVLHLGERVFVYALANHGGYSIAEYNKHTGEVFPLSKSTLKDLAGEELKTPEIIKRALKEYVKP